MLMRGRPTDPEVWPNGLPGPDIENGQNPIVVTTNATGYEKNPTDYLQSNGKIEITNPWIEGLKLTVMGSADKSINRDKKWETPWYLYTWDKKTYEADGVTPKLTKALRSTFTDPRLTQYTRSVFNTNATFLLNYDRTFADNHTFGLMVGTTREKFTGDAYQAYRRDYISSVIDQPFAGGTTQLITGGNDNRYTYNRTRIGYYGRLTYNYREKYLAEFVWRRDGSSIFPPGHQYGFFPGVLVGWNLSNESFMQSVSFINFLKIRASYGEMGNDQVYFRDVNNNFNLQEYAYLSAYSLGSYPINGQTATTSYEPVVPNPNFTWERAKNSNIGLDGTFFGGKVDLTLEYFYNKRDHILIQKQGSTPASSGITTLLPPVNAGRVDNKGFEFRIGYNNQISGLKYTLSANGGYAKNKVMFMDETPGIPAYQRQTGKPFSAQTGTSASYLVYEYAGVFKNAEEIASNTIDYSGVTNQLRPGDMKFRDVNKDGKITADDQVRLNKTVTPKFTYGISMNFQYGNFDLSILFQGATGGLLRFGTESGDIGNYLKYSYDHRWTIDHPSSKDPRLASRGDTYYTGGNYGNNTYNYFNTNYLRLKNAEIGYTIPANLLKKGGLTALRVYVNGLNLITWDKFKIWDPESISGSGQYYPQARVINAGFRLTF
jgi:TonB-linked SusC/RagA family outer membrane protein